MKPQTHKHVVLQPDSPCAILQVESSKWQQSLRSAQLVGRWPWPWQKHLLISFDLSGSSIILLDQDISVTKGFLRSQRVCPGLSSDADP